MTTITLEGKEYQLDIEQAKKLNLLKEKDGRVKSWEEFTKKYPNHFFHVISAQLTTYEEKALAAFSKLLKLRRDWIGEWEPDWTDYHDKFILYRSENEVSICTTCTTAGGLSFPIKQMAKEFLETFRDLIEEAKTLI
jgi:hypothetical protein